ncbi:MoaD/ThiS family protein [Psychrilyobacter piezotolerans]|uniref:MoaD/ThiS family protein n=1 Tax=Psychrilyobacter piezotolerans TaxID=2293438 RepID=A0ABX9KLA3_9FUSO|nr:MoaD/ThiS family protein [Psychrilyobacter piezotolerans]RDE66163.1 MoaD/ThiS family protein [Psychrilyobacter sp. S5]REI43341.1 MoaD/ThiS family protein [Psychrilyobacter piezotolerans]
MQIEIRLFAYLRELLPLESRGVKKIQVKNDLTIDDLMDEIGISEKEIMIVMINGIRKLDYNESMKEGDRVAIFPPVGGG